MFKHFQGRSRRRPSSSRRPSIEALEGRTLLSGVGDFNGDGIDDLAIGVPYDDVSGQFNAGGVNVVYGSIFGLITGNPPSTPPNRLWTQDSAGIENQATTNDRFGWALAAGDFNNDGFDDLAIGVPGEDVDGQSDAGAVHILFGSEDGLNGPSAPNDRLWTQNSPNIQGGADPFDNFGWALAAGNFDDNPSDDLAIGVPAEDIEELDLFNVGAVNIIYNNASSNDQFWIQDSTVEDVFEAGGNEAEPGDRFGWTLAAGNFGRNVNGVAFDDLAIGVPFEDLGNNQIDSAGALHVVYGSANGLAEANAQFVIQGNLNSQSEAGDEFGLVLAVGNFNGGFDDLAIGVPLEDLENNQIDNAGAVHVLRGDTNGLNTASSVTLTQETSGTGSLSQAQDQFGAALAAGDFGRSTHDDLAIGVPGKDLSLQLIDAGAVIVLYGSVTGPSATNAQFWTQNSPGSDGGPAQAGERFGSALSAGNFNSGDDDDLVVGIPRRNVGTVNDAGAVHVFNGSADGLNTVGDRLWHRDPPPDLDGEIDDDDEFGTSL